MRICVAPCSSCWLCGLQIHDFARAYGSLCWNLSKVIPRKDLPRIFTMCLPVKEASPSKEGLQDLHQTRHDVVEEVMKAPKRRIDNVITHLSDSVNLLMMHAVIVQDTHQQYMSRVWEHRMQEGGTLLTGMGLSAVGVYMGIPMEFTGGVMAATVLGVGGLTWFNRSKLSAVERQLLTAEELSASYQRTHAREVSEDDQFANSMWQRISVPLRLSLQSIGLQNVPTISKQELKELNSILDKDIPRLRRLASPSHFGH